MREGATNDAATPEVLQGPTNGEPVKPPAPASTPRNSFIRTRWQRIRGWLYWLFPNWGAVNRADLSYERSHDAEENEKTLVPTDLELRVPMVWGCELYGPAEINDLYAGLQKLGWGIAYRVGDKGGIEKWIKQNRAYGRQGGWLNGGHVVGRGERSKYIGITNHASLPDGVSSLDIQVFQLSPSLTGVLVGFRLDDTLARRYEDEINCERTTYRKRISRSRSISIIGPLNQKHDAVAHVRSALRQLVGNWYKQHLPGYFSAQDRETVLPIMEMLAVKEGPILHEPSDAPRGFAQSWRCLLSNVFPSQTWTCQQNDGIQLAMGDEWEEEQARLITVALDESRFSEDSMKTYGGKSSDSLIYVCGEVLRYILPHVATMEYLKEQTRYLNINREQLKMARAGRANLSRTLRAISQFFDQTLGVPALAREIAKKSKRPGWYRHEIALFTAPGWGSQAAPRQLSDDLQSSTYIMASRLAEDEVVMRGHFEQLSSILSIHESIKVQRRMESLTVVALVVAVFSLLAALAGPHTVTEWLKSIWKNDLSSF
ncbi:hypothetical protein [Rhodanobacter koreensis]